MGILKILCRGAAEPLVNLELSPLSRAVFYAHELAVFHSIPERCTQRNASSARALPSESRV